MTVLEVIQRSSAFLVKKGVESPRLQAELLLAHALRLPRMQLYLNFERVLGEPEQDLVRQMVRRRGERQPLQHILGSTSFCGLEIRVGPEVLIPRPETELLAEQGWIFLNERAASAPALFEGGAATTTDSASRPSALDFGTGSGCLAIALTVKCPGAHLVAVEIEPAALEVARQNAALHGLSGRIDFLLGDGLSVLPRKASFDLIAANPPYIPSAEIAQLQPEVRDHDPRRALDGGIDGLDFYRQLAQQAGPFLKPTGKIMLEFGDNQEQALTTLFEREKWIVERILSDYTQRPRILIARIQ